MHLVQELDGTGDILGGYRLLTRREGMDACPSRDDRERIVVLRVFQQGLDDVDLGPRQQRIATAIGFQQKDPIPPLTPFSSRLAPDGTAASGTAGRRARPSKSVHAHLLHRSLLPRQSS